MQIPRTREATRSHASTSENEIKTAIAGAPVPIKVWKVCPFILAQSALADEFFRDRAGLENYRASLACCRKFNLNLGRYRCGVEEQIAHAESVKINSGGLAGCCAQAALHLECRKIGEALVTTEINIVVAILNSHDGRVACADAVECLQGRLQLRGCRAGVKRIGLA